MLTLTRISRKKRKSRAAALDESGQGAVEFVVVLPIFFGLFFGTLIFSLWYFQQAAAGIAAGNAARAGGISQSVAVAESANSDFLASFGASAAVHTSRVSADPLRRAIIVRNEGASNGAIPFIGVLQLEIRGASFYRLWSFYPGPPDPWE